MDCLHIIKQAWQSRSDHGQPDHGAKTCWLQKSAMY